MWGKVERKNCFQRQSYTRFFRLTLVFMRNSTLRKSLISVFQEFFPSINKMFTLNGRLGTRLLLYQVLRFSWYFLSLKSFDNSWDNSYIPIFISNKKCASFHLLWKENSVKEQKVSKYYENDCGSWAFISWAKKILLKFFHRKIADWLKLR